MNVNEINKIIAQEKERDDNFPARDVSDTHHTFGELYHGRMVMSAVICNTYSHLSWKSWLHHDGTMFDGMFICGVETPKGQYTNHYKADHWDMFDIQDVTQAPDWDGHTAADIERLLSLLETD